MSAKKNHRRKHREKQPYRKSRAFDSSCRCHGSCSYCLSNRMHRVNRLRTEPVTMNISRTSPVFVSLASERVHP